MTNSSGNSNNNNNNNNKFRRGFLPVSRVVALLGVTQQNTPTKR